MPWWNIDFGADPAEIVFLLLAFDILGAFVLGFLLGALAVM